MDKLMYDLKDMILCDIDETVKKGQINPADYQALGEAVDIIKDIETIEAMRNYEYQDQEVSGAMSGGRMYPMGRFNSYNGGYSGNSYNSYGNNYGGYSGERGRSPRTGRYVSRDDETMAKLNNMMASAATDQERATIQRMMDELGR